MRSISRDNSPLVQTRHEHCLDVYYILSFPIFYCDNLLPTVSNPSILVCSKPGPIANVPTLGGMTTTCTKSLNCRCFCFWLQNISHAPVNAYKGAFYRYVHRSQLTSSIREPGSTKVDSPHTNLLKLPHLKTPKT